MEWGGQGTPRWAKCDYVTTVSLDRCCDPYRRPRAPCQARQYIRVKAIQADVDAIERCLLWALGITASKHGADEREEMSHEADMAVVDLD